MEEEEMEEADESTSFCCSLRFCCCWGFDLGWDFSGRGAFSSLLFSSSSELVLLLLMENLVLEAACPALVGVFAMSSLMDCWSSSGLADLEAVVKEKSLSSFLTAESRFSLGNPRPDWEMQQEASGILPGQNRERSKLFLLLLWQTNLAFFVTIIPSKKFAGNNGARNDIV